MSILRQVADMVDAHRAAVCSVEGCLRPREVRTFCEMHYARLRRAGERFQSQGFVKPAKPHEFLVDLFRSEWPVECVTWPFSSTGGYGHFRFKNKNYRSAVVVCEAVHGAKPSPKMHAAHDCGNSICCNPAHIQWKTPKDNIADKAVHGTTLAGERHHQCKLSEEQVVEIRGLRNRVSRRAIAERFGVGRSTIDNIIDRTTWRHI